ncbi:MAG: M20/M25/M40 family metallo-hydrolase, partial [Pyrinomonadaceae bacterium]
MFPATSDSIIERLLRTDKVRRAFEYFADNSAEITARQIELCNIPAPPFGEQKRAQYFRQKFLELGLANAQIDAEGNVLALHEGSNESPWLIVSAHLDTVFPVETDLTPRFENSKIFAPGIMDDGCGLVALLALAEVLEKLQISTTGSILFVGTVGEEGAGNLRGVRHLLTKGEFAEKITAFISLDGAGVSQIVNRALGSRRYKITLTGTGGHSWLDAGAPNPIHALGKAVAKLTAFSPVSTKDKTIFNVGTISGGTSVNSIPTAALMEVDLRSESSSELQRLDAYFRRTVHEAVTEENAAGKSNYSPLELNLELTGNRPSGATKAIERLVRLAIEATKAVGGEPNLTIS